MHDELKRFIVLIPERYGEFNAEECVHCLYLQMRLLSNAEFMQVQKARVKSDELCNVIVEKNDLNLVKQFADVVEKHGGNAKLAAAIRLQLDKDSKISTTITRVNLYGDFPLIPKLFFQRNEEVGLREAVQRLCKKDKPGALVVFGAKGVGKTTLVAQILGDQSFLINSCGVDTVIWLHCGASSHFDRDAFDAQLLAGILQVDYESHRSYYQHVSNAQSSAFQRLQDNLAKRRNPVLVVLDGASNSNFIPSTLQFGSMMRCIAICYERNKPISSRRDDWLVVEQFGIDKLTSDDVKAMIKCQNQPMFAALSPTQLKMLVDCSDGLPLIAALISANFRDCSTGERFRKLTAKFRSEADVEDMLQAATQGDHLHRNAVQLVRACLQLLPRKQRQQLEAFLLFNAEQPVEADDLAVLWKCSQSEALDVCFDFHARQLVSVVKHFNSSNESGVRKFSIHSSIFAVVAETVMTGGFEKLSELRSKLIDRPPAQSISENLLHQAIVAKRRPLLETILSNIDPHSTLPKLCGEPTGTDHQTPLHYLYNSHWRQMSNVSLLLFCQFVQKLAQLNKADTLNILNLDDDSGVSVAKLIRRDVQVCKKTEDNVFFSAAQLGYVSLVELLLNCSIQIDVENDVGDPALLIAVDNGHVALAQLLITSGGMDVNTANRYGFTALMIAAQRHDIESAQLFFDWQANIKAKNKDGDTALILAVMHGDANFVEAFLVNGANVNEKNAKEETALLLAARNGDYDTTSKLILCGADVNAANAYGFTPLIIAAHNGHVSIAQLLLVQPAVININAKNLYQKTALMTAAMHGNSEIVKLILEQGANCDVNACDSYNETAVSLAADAGHVEAVRLLLTLGRADVSIKNSNHQTAHEKAVRNGHATIAKLLVEHERNQTAGSYFANCVIQ